MALHHGQVVRPPPATTKKKGWIQEHRVWGDLSSACASDDISVQSSQHPLRRTAEHRPRATERTRSPDPHSLAAARSRASFIQQEMLEQSPASLALRATEWIAGKQKTTNVGQG
jgi:hypothetical protein